MATPPATVTAALRASGNLQPPEAYAAYTPYLALTARLIGERPSFYPVLSHSQAAIRTHVGLFSRMFHAPEVDLRLPGSLSPSLRRAAFLAASSAFQCHYCRAHAYAFGDMAAGCIAGQVRRGFAMAQCSPAEDAVSAFAAAACERPVGDMSALKEMAAGVQLLVGKHGLETVQSVVAFTGALNVVMDAQGAEVEEKGRVFEQRMNAEQDVRMEDKSGWFGAFLEHVANVAGLFQVMPSAIAAMWFEWTVLYVGIPCNADALNAWVRSRIGDEEMLFFCAIEGIELKRAFCFGLRENLLVEALAGNSGRRCWTLDQRLRFLFLFAHMTGSSSLKNVAVFLKKKEEQGRVDDEFHSYIVNNSKGLALSEEETSARNLVVATSSKLNNITPALVDRITSACTPDAVLELVSLLSFYEMWRRLDVLFTLDLKE